MADLYAQLANKVYEKYATMFPAARDTFDRLVHQAQSTGLVTTILGRRSRFIQWERKGHRRGVPLSYLEALEKYGERDIQRASTHKALNRLLQGSAADLMKMAMIKAQDAGIFDTLKAPLLTVHDELDLSLGHEPEQEEALIELINIMETALELNVPVKADEERGPSWGEVK